jgi:acyl carrier protein
MKIEIEYLLDNLKKILEVEYAITLETKFSEIENIDSLTYMSISAWLSDKTDTKISVFEIEKMITIQDLYILLKKY